jgi:hypothetical protein
MPLATSSVNMAGQPSKVGGTVARVFGWLVLAGGTIFSLLMAGLIQLIAASGNAGYIVGAGLEIVTVVLALVFLRGGSKLQEAGADTAKATQGQAIFALANTRGGVLTPAVVAHSIGIPERQADDILTSLAKEYPDHVTLDVDDNGTLLYRFNGAHWQAMARNPASWERPRVSAPQRVAAQPGVRVDARDPLEENVPDERPAHRQAR